MTNLVTFSSDDQRAINEQLFIVPGSLADGDNNSETLLDSYEVGKTAETIEAHNFQRIALQFPDELLHDSVPVYLGLKERLPDKEIFILADTTYGSCCVDEVASQHVDAELVVHYGHACMSLTSRIPVLYVFGKCSMDIGFCLSAFIDILGSNLPSNLILFYNVMYTYKMSEFFEMLKSALPPTNIHFSPITELLVQPRGAKDSPPSLSSQRFMDPPGLENNPTDYTVLFVGGESLALNNILLTHSQSSVYSLDPKSGVAKLESNDRSNKLLMKRYATMQKARDSDVFGILVGTLGVANYLPLISHLRSLITKARRKFYTISVGKLNPAKLANFPEIECYVLVACPENSIVESKEFARPIVTPYELYLALQTEPTWTGRLLLDFDRVMSEAMQGREKFRHETHQRKPLPDDEKDDDVPEFSLITGKYRSKKLYGSAKEERKLVEGEDSNTLVCVSQERGIGSRYRNPIGEYLQSRTYQGLDPRFGLDEPSTLEQGRSGIPKGYNTDEPTFHSQSQSTSGLNNFE